jgi:hypothetical protein
LALSGALFRLTVTGVIGFQLSKPHHLPWRTFPIEIWPHVGAALAAGLHTNRGSISDNLTSSGNVSPSMAIECEQ